jgi:hypothetical protein
LCNALTQRPKEHQLFRGAILAAQGPAWSKETVITVAASILITAYHMLAGRHLYQDFGAYYFARRDPRRVVAKLASRVRRLCYHAES